MSQWGLICEITMNLLYSSSGQNVLFTGKTDVNLQKHRDEVYFLSKRDVFDVFKDK